MACEECEPLYKMIKWCVNGVVTRELFSVFVKLLLLVTSRSPFNTVIKLFRVNVSTRATLENLSRQRVKIPYYQRVLTARCDLVWMSFLRTLYNKIIISCLSPTEPIFSCLGSILWNFKFKLGFFYDFKVNGVTVSCREKAKQKSEVDSHKQVPWSDISRYEVLFINSYYVEFSEMHINNLKAQLCLLLPWKHEILPETRQIRSQWASDWCVCPLQC